MHLKLVQLKAVCLPARILFLQNSVLRLVAKTSSQENKYQVWRIFLEAPDVFPSYFIQSKTSTSGHDRVLRKQGDEQIRHFAGQYEYRGLTPVSEAGFLHQWHCNMIARTTVLTLTGTLGKGFRINRKKSFS